MKTAGTVARINIARIEFTTDPLARCCLRTDFTSDVRMHKYATGRVRCRQESGSEKSLQLASDFTAARLPTRQSDA
jgi:hypothetical protein